MTMPTDNPGNELETRTEVVAEEPKAAAEASNPTQATAASDAKTRKTVRWYEGYRAGYFC